MDSWFDGGCIRMIKTNRTLPIGTFLRVPLGDGSFAYGRVLSSPYIAFYDYRTNEPTSHLDVIEQRLVLFSQAVRLRDLDRWTALGSRPLKGQVAEPVVRFRQDLVDPTDCVLTDSTGGTRRASPQECIGVERAAVWDGRQIERRLLDHFTGRPNDEEVRLRVHIPEGPRGGEIS